MESLGAAKAKNNGGGGVRGDIKGLSTRRHLNMARLFLFMPPLQCKSRL